MLRGTNKRVLSGVHVWETEKGGVIIMVSVIIIIMVSVMSLQSLEYIITIVSHHHAPCRVIAVAHHHHHSRCTCPHQCHIFSSCYCYIIISQFGLLLDVCSCTLCVLFVCFLPQTLGKLKEKSSILFSSSGPDYWGTINPEWALCHKGKQQSPIDIEPSRLLYDPNLKHLKIESTYVSTNSFKIHT